MRLGMSRWSPLLLPLGGCGAVDGSPGWVAAALLGAAALGIAGLAWRGWGLRRRWQDLAARNARLAAANVELKSIVERAEAKSRMMDGVLAAMSDGVMATDAELRLVGWNARFAELAGVPRRALRIGMPLEEVLRLQAEGGEFGLVDPEAEVARRMTALRNGTAVGRWQRERPDGSRIELRRAPLPGGGYVTLYSAVEEGTPKPREGLEEAFRAEWAARMPRLTAAAADNDATAARSAAHALRGIAANAGWVSAASTLGAIEAAAEEANMREVRALTAMLALDTPW
jgi:PAS domain-containing protein